MRIIAVILIVLLALVGFRFYRRAQRDNVNPPTTTPPVTTPTSPGNTTAPPSKSNPFGVMLGAKATANSIRSLKVAYYRPVSLFIDSWNGSCAECDLALSQGVKLILTVRTNGGNGKPSSPATNLTAYKSTLGQILDKYRPEVLVVENEENSAALFYSGTVDQYHAQLKAACEVAHSKGIKCTNGGLVSSLTALLTATASSNPEAYLETALGPKFEDLGVSTSQVLKLPKAQQQLERGRALLAGYKSAGADYVNFHWYVADTNSLTQAVNYLEQATGLPAMSNEVGQQKNTSPTQVSSVMQKIVDLGLPYAVWFSVDVNGYGGATSLVEQNGTLRPNGQAFADFIETHY